jgi:hypothetical protein
LADYDGDCEQEQHSPDARATGENALRVPWMSWTWTLALEELDA